MSASFNHSEVYIHVTNNETSQIALSHVTKNMFLIPSILKKNQIQANEERPCSPWSDKYFQITRRIIVLAIFHFIGFFCPWKRIFCAMYVKNIVGVPNKQIPYYSCKSEINDMFHLRYIYIYIFLKRNVNSFFWWEFRSFRWEKVDEGHTIFLIIFLGIH